MAGPTTAFAQSTWSLPPGQQEGQGAPRPQGPVDPQNPTVTPRDTAPDAPAAAPAAAPTSRPTPVPTIAAPPPPAARASDRPQPRATQPAATATPARPAEPSRTEPAAAAPSPAVTPSAQLPAPAPALAPAPTPTASESAALPAQPSAAPEADLAGPPAATPHWPEWWLAIPAALVAAGVGVFLLLRRRRAPATAWEEAGLEPEAEPEDEIVQETADAPVAAAAIAALDPVAPVSPAPRVQPLRNPGPQSPSQPAPAAIPTPNPAPARAPAPSGPGVIAVDFEPVTLRLSLVYATLQYRLTLAAPESGLAEPWRVLGDMISAHASLSQVEQLAPEPAALPLRHTLEALAPGETRTFKGELQLPLNAIRVMRQGQASLFVPLVRLCLVDEHGHAERRVFSLGVPGEGPDPATVRLAPIRLDTGPRDHATIAAREVEAARDMGQDPDSPMRRLA
jgi:hypothetical protein